MGFRQWKQKVQRPWGRNGVMDWKHRNEACAAEGVGVFQVRGRAGAEEIGRCDRGKKCRGSAVTDLWVQPLSAAGIAKEGDRRRAPWRRRASTRLEDGKALEHQGEQRGHFQEPHGHVGQHDAGVQMGSFDGRYIWPGHLLALGADSKPHHHSRVLILALGFLCRAGRVGLEPAGLCAPPQMSSCGPLCLLWGFSHPPAATRGTQSVAELPTDGVIPEAGMSWKHWHQRGTTVKDLQVLSAGFKCSSSELQLPPWLSAMLAHHPCPCTRLAAAHKTLSPVCSRGGHRNGRSGRTLGQESGWPVKTAGGLLGTPQGGTPASPEGMRGWGWVRRDQKPWGLPASSTWLRAQPWNHWTPSSDLASGPSGQGTLAMELTPIFSPSFVASHPCLTHGAGLRQGEADWNLSRLTLSLHGWRDLPSSHSWRTEALRFNSGLASSQMWRVRLRPSGDPGGSRGRRRPGAISTQSISLDSGQTLSGCWFMHPPCIPGTGEGWGGPHLFYGYENQGPRWADGVTQPGPAISSHPSRAPRLWVQSSGL
ncbi:hypothetical protein Cadr_000013325 [Camelus dromedarius]|uniref:Uncharacterized protein n=1 Tax=Camelus dromedarius TaxID=9838 RepID=A0A5N4DBE8_CAMDR|nr:hypothetical protein Cadr_000013325 [Camelus dromedarius]